MEIFEPHLRSDLAICICTRNRAADLRRCLSALAQSKTEPLQVIVSDDSSPELAAATAAVCAAVSQTDYLQGPRQGLSANRNNCLSALRNDVKRVMFLDDDAVIGQTFITDMMRALGDVGPEAIVTGREWRRGDEVAPRNCSFLGHQKRPPTRPDDYHSIVMNATVFPRSLFDQARFDPALYYGNDEVDICAQAEQLGYRIVFRPELITEHYLSDINRTEYVAHIEASRLYATYKRYRWLEGRRWKAMLFSVAASLHLIASGLKRDGIFGISKTLTSLRRAVSLTNNHRRLNQRQGRHLVRRVPSA